MGEKKRSYWAGPIPGIFGEVEKWTQDGAVLFGDGQEEMGQGADMAAPPTTPPYPINYSAGCSLPFRVTGWSFKPSSQISSCITGRREKGVIASQRNHRPQFRPREDLRYACKRRTKTKHSTASKRRKSSPGKPHPQAG